MDHKARKKLENLLYRLTHRDYKGRNGDGTRSVLHNESGVTYGTESWPLSTFTDAQLTAALKGFGSRKLVAALRAPLQRLLDKSTGFLEASEVEWAALRASLAAAVVEGQSDEELLETTRVLAKALAESRTERLGEG
jgi:hypothetical protein